MPAKTPRLVSDRDPSNRASYAEIATMARLPMTNLELVPVDRVETATNGIIGNSPALQSALAEVKRVAATDSTVLVLGETGTGKDLIAHAIHNLSSRSGRPFVSLSCAAIPLDLLESELFGHERGAFTGAIVQKIGRFEMADTGTLFLDEIGDLPPALQPKLLRVVQAHEFERLGSGKTHRVNVRLVAATHRDLGQMIRRGEFRSDLYYRLNVFPVMLPPLRHRREDIPQLASHFIEIVSQHMGKKITRIPKETMDALTAYSWPGNVRELQNLIERAVIRADNGVLLIPLPTDEDQAAIPATATSDNNPGRPNTIRGTFTDCARALILETLQATGWLVGGPGGAAERLGLKRTTLVAKMKKLGISRPTTRNRISSSKLRSNQEYQHHFHIDSEYSDPCCTDRHAGGPQK
jgi:formate hydrogenlyase transcriptional activator